MLVIFRIIIILIWKKKKKNNTKSVKQSNIITQQLKAIENPNTVHKKSIFIEHPKTFTSIIQDYTAGC